MFSTSQRHGAGVVFGSIPFGSGGTVGMPTGIFDRLAGIDATMRGCEDVDFSVRLWLAGIPLEPAEGAVCHYRQPDDAKTLYRQKRAYARAHVSLVKKYWPLIDVRGYAYWQFRGLVRLPKQLVLSSYHCLRGGDLRLVGVERVATIAGYLSGSAHHRIFVLCPWGDMLRPLSPPHELDDF